MNIVYSESGVDGEHFFFFLNDFRFQSSIALTQSVPKIMKMTYSESGEDRQKRTESSFRMWSSRSQCEFTTQEGKNKNK